MNGFLRECKYKLILKDEEELARIKDREEFPESIRQQGTHARKFREDSMFVAQRIRGGSHRGWRSDWLHYNLRMLWPS